MLLTRNRLRLSESDWGRKMDPIGWFLAIGWGVTAAGWLVTSLQANKRETRKEYRAEVTALEVSTDRLLEAYRRYLSETDEAKCEQARLQVHSDVNRVRRRVEGLEGAVGGEICRKFENLFEVLTGGDFESKSRRSGSGNNYARVVTAAEDLLECAETWFRNKYQA